MRLQILPWEWKKIHPCMTVECLLVEEQGEDVGEGVLEDQTLETSIMMLIDMIDVAMVGVVMMMDIEEVIMNQWILKAT